MRVSRHFTLSRTVGGIFTLHFAKCTHLAIPSLLPLKEREREGRRGRLLTETSEGEARDYLYAGTETSDAKVGRWSCAETRWMLVEGVSGHERDAPPCKDIGQQEEKIRAVQELLCNNKGQRLYFGRVTVWGWNYIIL